MHIDSEICIPGLQYLLLIQKLMSVRIFVVSDPDNAVSVSELLL